MLDQKGFNQWAGHYDSTIDRFSKGYPFEGYYDVLSYVQSRIVIAEGAQVLDLGVGTGLMTKFLYDQGAGIVGADFSEEMLALAKAKMPKAELIAYDFNDPLPRNITDSRFDYIVSSYAIHHVADDRKVQLIESLVHLLKPGGLMLIADVAFETEEALEAMRLSCSEGWDEDEHYMTGASMRQKLAERGIGADYVQISVCAGVLTLSE